MKPEDAYLKFVQWSDEDRLYVGFCPDLFPWGGICHAVNEEDAYRDLCVHVRDELVQICEEGRTLPKPQTRPMREAVPA